MPGQDAGVTLPALDTPYPVAPDAADRFAATGHAMLPGLATAGEVAAYREALERAAASGIHIVMVFSVASGQ